MNTLEEVQASAAMPMEEALRYATSLAALLRQMHRDRTVYGRLDPKNIEWDKHSVKLAQTDASTGAYIAPEQVRGETADARSDIFSFGAILYQLLAGRRAFPADDPEELKTQILESSPPPIEAIPEGIASLLRGCLEKDPAFRWQRMNFILIELKLASASARQAHSVAEWKETVLSLRSQVAAHDEQFAAQQATHEITAAELRQSVQQILADLAANQNFIARLQKSSQMHTEAIKDLQVAASQTDQVVEHVVEAFGTMNKSVVEREEAKALLPLGEELAQR
jgi:serine/threonine protein kinase